MQETLGLYHPQRFPSWMPTVLCDPTEASSFTFVGSGFKICWVASRASFFLPWLSMWWELLEQDSVKVLLPACGWHAYRSTAPDVHLISCQVYSCPWRHWKMKGPLPAGLICFHDGTRVRIPAIVSTSFWRKGLENLGKCLPLWICFAFLNPHKDVKRGARLGLQLSTGAIES